MKNVLLFIAVLLAVAECPAASAGGDSSARGVDIRFQQPMRSDRVVVVSSRQSVEGLLRLFTIVGSEVARSPFEIGVSGVFRWRLEHVPLASGIYLLSAEWTGGRKTKILLLLR